MTITPFRAAAALLCCSFFSSDAFAAHPQVLATPPSRVAVLDKINRAAWAQEAYAHLKATVDPLVEKSVADPGYVTSRMLMNWDTHYTTTLVQNRRTVGGEGHAAVPTPRFEGARDWATIYKVPPRFEDWRPFNDRSGQLFLLNTKTGEGEWVDPGFTGDTIRRAHEWVLNVAADAAFLYWLSGDEKYARFSADILCTWMAGFAATTAPKTVMPDKGLEQIVGATCLEVIHEGAAVPAALAYDFLQPYLEKRGCDTQGIKSSFKRWARAVAGSIVASAKSERSLL